MYQKTVLPNGLTIITEEVASVRTAAVGIFVGVGSRDETPAEAGTSHFIEHLMFKGTDNRNARQIAEAFDDIGGQLNAYTTKEYTCYYARIMDEHFDIATEILSDMLLHPKFAAEDIQKEKGVIIEEINMSEDAYDELVFDVFVEALWQEHVLGQAILGTAASVTAATREQIVNYYQQHYQPGNMIIAVAGNISHQQAAARFSELFGAAPTVTGYHKERLQPQAFVASSCKVKQSEQVNLCLGREGLEVNNSELYGLQVLSTIVGGGVSSRLFQEVREERGLVYTIYSYTSSYEDTGLFLIYAALSRQNAGQAIGLILQQLQKMTLEEVSEAELNRAKNQLKVGLLFSLESISTRMGRLGKAEIYHKKLLEVDEIIALVDAVTVQDIKNLAVRFFDPQQYVLAAVGPWQTERTVRELAQHMDELAAGEGEYLFADIPQAVDISAEAETGSEPDTAAFVKGDVNAAREASELAAD